MGSWAASLECLPGVGIGAGIAVFLQHPDDGFVAVSFDQPESGRLGCGLLDLFECDGVVHVSFFGVISYRQCASGVKRTSITIAT